MDTFSVFAVYYSFRTSISFSKPWSVRMWIASLPQPPHLIKDPAPPLRGGAGRPPFGLDDTKPLNPYRDAPRGGRSAASRAPDQPPARLGVQRQSQINRREKQSIKGRGFAVLSFPQPAEGAGRGVFGPWRDFRRMAGASAWARARKTPVRCLVKPKALRAGIKSQIEKIDGRSQQAKAVGQPGSSQVSEAAA